MYPCAEEMFEDLSEVINVRGVDVRRENFCPLSQMITPPPPWAKYEFNELASQGYGVLHDT